MDKIQSKGIKSIRSRVANITEFLNEEMTTEEFRQLLLETIFEGETEIPTYELTEEDWKEIHKLSERALPQLGLELRKISEVQLTTFTPLPSWTS